MDRSAQGLGFAVNWVMTRLMIRKLILCSTLIWSLGATSLLAQSSAKIEASTLQDVGPWGAAALPEGLDRLDSDLWIGADPGTLAIVFERIQADQRFPVLQRLVRQAIFSGGAAPTGDQDLARGRFRAASKLGPAEATARLFDSVPRLNRDPALTFLAMDAAFRAGRTEEACSWLSTPGLEATPESQSGTLWLESRAVCYALNNEGAAANLSVDLARTKGLTDTWLGRAVAASSGPVSSPPPLRADSGRALALSIKAGLKIPRTTVSSGDPASLSAILNWPDIRTSVTEEDLTALMRRAAQTGVATPAQEARLRGPVLHVVTPEAVTAPVAPTQEAGSSLAPEPPPPPLAFSWASRISQSPNAQARALEARLLVPDLKAHLATAPEQIPDETLPALIEAALWVGDAPLAQALRDRSTRPMSPRQRLILALLDPVADDRPVQRHIETATNPAAQRQAVRDALIAWSAGLPPQGGLSALLQPGLPDVKGGQAGVRTALSFAAARGAKGEVILLAGLALQGQEPASADAETVAIAVSALRQVGLRDGAVALAREYLLALDMVVPTKPSATGAANPAPTGPAVAAPPSNRASPPPNTGPSSSGAAAPAAPRPKAAPANPPQPKAAPASRPPASQPKAKVPPRGQSQAPSRPPARTQAKPNWTPPN
ncbi:hypothetical protein PbB2_00362 [Candidatus Phycosocius bacilliformis]|uniref:Uncharacterized protein n=2 Tax=Candidatus Phycosocius bacilliformis TaxID=1445552 RepID=A0A2P2E6L9_9PROT|nr:hypothetical protein PbB2_00362 [Candidatus Phycosocius bacilliformis]